jgi:biopolymer transport protein ExbD/biopolymer transport protein TolR
MSMDIGSKSVKSDINVTPLVDVVLVLLIIFMVITPLLQRGKAVQLPQAKLVSELKAGGDPILLSVTRDKKIFLDKNEVKKETLADALTNEMAALPGSPVILKGDRELDYKTIREVILEVTKTHVMGVSLAASELKEKESK